MTTFEQILDSVMELPSDQRSMIVDILQNRSVMDRRREIAANAESSMELYRTGKLKSQSAEELISELRSLVSTDTDWEDDEL